LPSTAPRPARASRRSSGRLLRNGETAVLAANPKHELRAIISLGACEDTNSSVAISDGQIFIRTFKHLWCIGEKK